MRKRDRDVYKKKKKERTKKKEKEGNEKMRKEWNSYLYLSKDLIRMEMMIED